MLLRTTNDNLLQVSQDQMLFHGARSYILGTWLYPGARGYRLYHRREVA